MKTSSQAIFALGIALLVLVVFAGWRADEKAFAASGDRAALSSSASRLFVLRLRPGDDLVDSIMAFAREHSIEAGGIVTCVGSLDHVRL